MKLTQNKMIGQYLLEGNSITQLEAFDLFGIWRLASRISDLKQKSGMIIKKTTVKVPTRFCGEARIARYSL